MGTNPARLFFDKIISERKQLTDVSSLIISEDLCKKCGICCRDKIWVGDNYTVKILNTKCKFLKENNLCAVYGTRHRTTETCVSVTDAILGGILPRSCGYIEKNWDRIKEWYISPITEHLPLE